MQIDYDALSFLPQNDKDFIKAFSERLAALGYEHAGLQNGICWGKYMLIYRKSGAKSDKVYARIYVNDDGITLRLFLNNVSRYASYITAAPQFISSVFTGDAAACKHCSDECKFRKTYEIDGKAYEKCNGLTFRFEHPLLEQLDAYLDLFCTFFCPKAKKRTAK